MATSFKKAVLDHVNADPKLAKGKLGTALANVEAHDDGPIKRLAWKMMENRARRRLGYDATESVDWGSSAIDWKTLLDLLVKILPLILALFGL
jgi:hypothetical protein